MINKRYLNEANRIRETYIRTIDNIKKEESLIENYKKEIEDLMKSNSEYINKNSKLDINKIKENLKEELNEIEIKIIKITEKMQPFFDKIDKLRDDSRILYRNIKEEYPELSETEIQKLILNFIKI